MEVETLKVVCAELENGFMIINKVDFDPEVHTEFDAEVEAPVKPLKKAKS